MIVFYTGSDTYRLRTAVQKHAPFHGPLDMTSEEERIELVRLLKYPSLFQESFSVVVRNILADADTAQAVHDILTTYEVPSLTHATVVICQEDAPGRPSAATKALSAYLTSHAKQKESYEPLRGSELEKWVKDFCAQRSTSIEPTALSALLQRTGDHTWAIANELEKLCAYANTAPITAEMVNILIPERSGQDEFWLANTLAAGDKRGAIAALWTRLRGGESEQLLLGSLAYSIRTLLLVSDMTARHIAPVIIAKQASLPPFVIAKMLRGSTAWRRENLERAHSELALLDRRSKDGTADAADSLFSLVMDL